MDRVDEPQKLMPLSTLPLSSGRSIGAFLVDSGKITPEDAERVLRLQRERGIKFGEAAIQLGLVTEVDLEQALSSQFEYPYLHGEGSGISHEVIAAYQPFSRQVEQLRAIRSQLMLRWFSGDEKVLSVVSPRRAEGRSYLAANLAVVFSQLGERTLLIDADLRNPKQHQLFNIGDRSGLSTILSGRGAEEHIKRITGLVDLSVLPAGPIPPNPQELLGRPFFNELLKDRSDVFDVIIVDTPAAELSADAQTIAVRAGGALILAQKNRTTVRGMQRLSAAVVGTGGKIVGTVLNDF